MRPALPWLLLLCAACDSSGIPPLGRLRDALVPCEASVPGTPDTTSTWVRSTDDGTEVVILGRASPTSVVPQTEPACYAHAFVARNSQTTLDFGSYSLGANGSGSAVHSVTYEFAYQPEVAILGRDGSVRHDHVSPIGEALTIRKDGTQLLMTLGTEQRRMTALGEVVDRLDVTTQAGAEQVFQVYNLPLFISQSRLLGFGSGAMTQYVGATRPFGGMIRNQFTVSVDSFLKPATLISYHQFEDLTGIVLDGPQHSFVDTSGNGPMGGSIGFILRGSGGATDVRVRGHVDYADIRVGKGLAAGGTYSLQIDGIRDPYAISYTLAANVDLRGALPVQTP